MEHFFNNGVALLIACVSLLCLPNISQQATLKTGCSITVNGGLANPQALVLKPGGNNDWTGFFYPGPNGAVTLNAGEEVRLACSGSTNYLKPLGSTVQQVIATCVSERTFSIPDGRTFYFNELACNANPFHTARRTGQYCADDNPLVDIGFELGDEFFKIIEVCFDEADHSTLYTKFNLVSGIGGFQSGFPRPEFVDTGFFEGLDPDNLYKRVTQRDTISRLLGSTALGDQYISQSNDYFLSKGHLVAKADFVYGAHQRGTFHFVNASPQWQTFNGASWNVLEQNLRDYAASKSLDLEVYTGSHGITTLPNIDNVETELFLYVDENDNKGIPVPKLFWKVAYNPKTEEGVVLLGVNNPYIELSKLGDDYLICEDICDEVSWIHWTQNDVKKGVSYCCSVDEFRTIVDTLPSFPVSGILG